MTLLEITCDTCTITGKYVYTTDYLGTGASGYMCSICYTWWTEQEFANKYPDYNQSNDHSIPVTYP